MDVESGRGNGALQDCEVGNSATWKGLEWQGTRARAREASEGGKFGARFFS